MLKINVIYINRKLGYLGDGAHARDVLQAAIGRRYFHAGQLSYVQSKVSKLGYQVIIDKGVKKYHVKAT